MINLMDMINLWGTVNGKEPTDVLVDIELDDRLDKEILALYLQRYCGSLYVVFNNTKAFEFNHKAWFRMWKHKISEYCDIEELDYDPLENYRMNEEINKGREEGRTDARNIGSDNTYANHTSTSGTSHSDNSSEHTVSAYNESVYQPEDKTINVDDTKSSDSTDSSGTSGTITSDVTKGNTVENEKERNLRHGNTGIYSYQKIIEDERELKKFNIYMWIIKRYKKDNLYLVH